MDSPWIGNSPETYLTPDHLGCDPYYPTVAASYSVATGQSNARKMQEFLQASATRQKTLLMPLGKRYCVADHDADGYDIAVNGISGLCWTTASGWNDRISDDDVITKFSASCQGGLIHVGDVGPSGDSVVRLKNFRGCRIELNIWGKLCTTTSAAITAINFSDPANHTVAPIAFVATDDNVNESTSGKSELSIHAVLCNRVCDIYADPTWGPDGISFPRSSWRYCHYGTRVRGFQAIGFHFGDIRTSGSPMQRGIEFLADTTAGGDLIVDNWYLSPGTNLYVDSPSALSRCDIYVRADTTVIDHPTFKLLEMGVGNSGSLSDIRIRGSFSQPADHQTIIVYNDATGRHDVQADLGNMFGDESGSYPLRPLRGQWVHRLYNPNDTVSSSTIFFLNADRDAPDRAVSFNPFNNVTNAGVITALADVSGQGNHVSVDTTNPTIGYGAINCRDAVLFSSDRLVRANADLNGLADAIDDMALFFVLKPTAASSGNIFWLRDDVSPTDVDGANGVRIYMNANGTVGVMFGADAVATTTAALNVNRSNSLVVIRKKSTGDWIIIVNGSTVAIDTGNSTAQLAAVTGPLVIGQNRATASDVVSYDTSFTGYISQVVVDTDDFIDVVFDGSTITATTDAAGLVLTLNGGHAVADLEEGQYLIIKGGTNFVPGIYRINDVNTGANTWTVGQDVSTGGAGSAMTGYLMSDAYNTRLQYLRQFGVW